MATETDGKVSSPNGAPTRRTLSRADILNVNDQRYVEVPVPEWGDDVQVRIRALTAKERDDFEGKIASGPAMNYDNVRARFLALVAVDENNQPLFTEADIPLLGLKSAAALNRIFNVGSPMSGLTKTDVEDLAKNSGSTRAGGSSSNSR